MHLIEVSIQEYAALLDCAFRPLRTATTLGQDYHWMNDAPGNLWFVHNPKTTQCRCVKQISLTRLWWLQLWVCTYLSLAHAVLGRGGGDGQSGKESEEPHVDCSEEHQLTRNLLSVSLFMPWHVNGCQHLCFGREKYVWKTLLHPSKKAEHCLGANNISHLNDVCMELLV